jgi:hypothetical protein
MTRQKQYPINPAEAHTLKAAIYDLSDLAAKQALYGILKMLSIKAHLNRIHFEEVIDDARKLTEIKKTQGL